MAVTFWDVPGDFSSIQQAIDGANSGDTIIVYEGTYTENLTLDGKALTIKANEGDTVDIVASNPALAVVTITGDVAAAADGNVTFQGIGISGSNTYGVHVTGTAEVNKLTLDDVSVHSNLQHGVFVDGSSDPASVDEIEITDSTFENATPPGNGSATNIKLFGFTGDALFQNVTVTGAPGNTDVTGRPDYGIELHGFPNGDFSPSDTVAAPDMGTIVFDNVLMTGEFHKAGVAINNYDDISGLSITDLDLSGAETDPAWGPVFNLDGITSNFNASGFGLSLPVADLQTALQGDTPNQIDSDQTITGTAFNDQMMGKGGNDTINGGDGDDVIYGHDKPGGDQEGETGNDILNGEGGDDMLFGGGGDDTLIGTAGDDTLSGGDGTDTAVLTATERDFADFDFSGVTVTAGVAAGEVLIDERTLTLDGIEVIQSGTSSTFIVLEGMSIQTAIDAASDGDTILIGPGTFKENIVVDKEGLTLTGHGDDTVIQGTYYEDNGIGDGESLAEWYKTAAAYDAGAGIGIAVAADNVTISDVKVQRFSHGVDFTTDADGTEINDVSLMSNFIGIEKPAESDITDLAINGGSITDGYIGIDFAKTTTIGDGLADGIVIDGTHFDDLLRKGIYAEALSNALLTNITMNQVGEWGSIGPNNGGVAGAGGNGINLNLKYGVYQNVKIEKFTFTDVGSSDREGLDANGHHNGGAIVVEVRDDAPSYSGNPAVFVGPIQITDGVIDGTSTGIHTGEPGKANNLPALFVDNVAITGAEHSATHGEIGNVTNSVWLVRLTDGDDSIMAAPSSIGAFFINGLGGDDQITAGGLSDLLNGGSGNDMLFGGLGDDILVGGSGSDRLTGGAGSDDLAGGGAKDFMKGGTGDDTLRGGAANDRLYGGAGEDILNGGGGQNKMTGGDDADTFVFANAFGKGYLGKITDFTTNEDVIQVENSIYAKSGPQNRVLKAKKFEIGKEADDKKDRFIYDDQTGNLFYDRDGSESGFHQVKIAKLDAGLDLDAGDIFVI